MSKIKVVVKINNQIRSYEEWEYDMLPSLIHLYESGLQNIPVKIINFMIEVFEEEEHYEKCIVLTELKNKKTYNGTK